MPELDGYTYFADIQLLQTVLPFEATRDYEALLQLLHGNPDIEMKLSTMMALFKEESEVIVFLVAGGQIVATAQGTLCRTEPLWQVFVNNVVVHDDHQGFGHGRRVMLVLEKEIARRWGENGSRGLKLTLTSSPEKQTSGFYEKEGWTPRVKAQDNETVVWVKHL